MAAAETVFTRDAPEIVIGAAYPINRGGGVTPAPRMRKRASRPMAAV